MKMLYYVTYERYNHYQEWLCTDEGMRNPEVFRATDELTATGKVELVQLLDEEEYEDSIRIAKRELGIQ